MRAADVIARSIPLPARASLPDHPATADAAVHQPTEQIWRVDRVAGDLPMLLLRLAPAELDAFEQLCIDRRRPCIMLDDPVRLRPQLHPFVLAFERSAFRLPM